MNEATSGPGTMPGLKREASLFQVVAYGIGNIIGAGVYVLVGDAAGIAGNAVWLAFFLGSVVALFTGLSYAELASMYPKAASEYVYLGKAYGNRRLAFLTEWVMLVTEIIAATAVSFGFAGYLQAAIGTPILPVSGVLLVSLSVLSLAGVKTSLRLNTFLSLVAVGGLLLVVAAGIGRVGTVPLVSTPNGFFGVLGASALVFFAYIGFDNIANLSEETKQPEKTIPRGLLIAVAISTVAYVLVGISSVSLVPWQQLSQSEAPLALAASVTLGPQAYDVLTIAALLTTLNTVLVLLIVSSRIVYGMAADGILPKAFSRVSAKARTPYAASLLVLLVSLAMLPLGSVSVIAKVTSFGSLITFALVNVALLHLRRVAPHLSRPFKSPLSIGWVSVTALLGLLTCIVLLTQFDLFSVAFGGAFLLSGVIFYQLTAQNKSGLKSIHEPHERSPRPR